MNNAHTRRMDKLDREEVFMTTNAADFPATSAGGKITAELIEDLAEFRRQDALQTSGFDDQRQAQSEYHDARDHLIDLLEMFVLAAAVVDHDVDGTREKYRMPGNRSDANLIAKADSFYNDSAALEAAFEAAGADENSRAALLAAKNEFQQRAAAHDAAEQMHTGATRTMDDLMKAMMVKSRKRESIVKLRYRANPKKLAPWLTASHLDRAPKSAPKTSAKTPASEPEIKE